MAKPLPLRWARFAEEYAIDLDGQKAAERTGCSKNGAKVWACRLLKNPRVKALVDKRIAERSKKTGVTLDRVLEELALIAFVDPKDFYDKDGKLLAVPDMPEHARRALAGMDVNDDGTLKIRYDKRSALAELREHLAPPKKLQLEGSDGQPLVVQIVQYGGKKP